MLRTVPVASYNQNIKCGTVFYYNPKTYQVVCEVCNEKILYQVFPKHFRTQHLEKGLDIRLLDISTAYIDDISIKEEHLEDDLVNIVSRDLHDVAIGTETHLASGVNTDTNGDDVNIIESLANEKEEQIVEEHLENDPIGNEEANIKANLLLEKIKNLDKEIEQEVEYQQEHYQEHELQHHNQQEEEIIEIKVDLESDFVEDIPPSTESHLSLDTKKEQEDSLDTIEEETCVFAVDEDHASDDSEDDKDFEPEDDFPSEEEPKPLPKRAGRTKKALPFQCDQCNRRFHTIGLLTRHKNLHMRTKTRRKAAKEYKCDQCDEKFRTERECRSHKYKHTGIICDVCGLSFSQVGNLKRHKLRHTGVKQFKCDDCGKMFYTDKELNSHKIWHTQQFRFICEICAKPCVHQANLKQHMRRHTGERPYKCELCGKCFFTQHDLNVHSAGHSDVRPFTCEICGSTFRLKKALRVHKKTHVKERPYVCDICGKGFIVEAGLKAHMRCHDGTLMKIAQITAPKEGLTKLGRPPGKTVHYPEANQSTNWSSDITLTSFE